MKSTISISVVICFYNDELYLGEAIESVLSQTFTQWELVLVDDGSSDGSAGIAKRYVSEHPGKISCVHHEGRRNKGLSESRNLGIQHARGELIAFLDADDVYLPAYLQNQHCIFTDNSEIGMVCEATEYWYSWEKAGAPDLKIAVGARQDRIFEPPELALHLYPLAKGNAPCTCGTIVRKTIIERHGGFEKQFTGMYEDQAFLIKIYLHERVYISSECNNRYRQRSGSMMNTAYSQGRYHHYRKMFLRWLLEYCQSTGYKHPMVLNLLRAAALRYRFPVLFKIGSKMKSLTHRLMKKSGKL